jgi:hypothetical protein
MVQLIGCLHRQVQGPELIFDTTNNNSSNSKISTCIKGLMQALNKDVQVK